MTAAPSQEALALAREICDAQRDIGKGCEAHHGIAFEDLGCICPSTAPYLAPIIERAEKAEHALAEAAMEINCAGPVASRIRVLKLEFGDHVERLAKQRDAAIAALRDLLREEAIRDDGHFALERAREVARAVLRDADARERS